MTDYLELDGESLHIPECRHTEDIAPLLSGSAHRGADELVPGITGVIAYPRDEDVTVVSLRIIIMGWKNSSGVDHADTRTGLALNIAELQELVTKPVSTGDGTRTATLHVAALAPVSKPCHVLGDMSLAGYGPHAVRGVIRLSFPEGLFDLSGWLP